LFGGKIKSVLTGKTVDLSGRDFRFKPDTGEIEPVAGLSQMGRIRDDYGNWFGNDNGTLLWHYPLEDHYLRRNPHVSYPDPRLGVARDRDPSKLYPISRTLERFNDPQAANRVTSACGPGIYRDVLLGPDYYGNAFVCEPVHNLVRRMVIQPDGVSFAGRRAAGEEQGEFLSSTDNWFRPVQARTGPDGALWIVDMYRFVVEHPRWIPPERLKELNPRAGANMGRIYRIRPVDSKPGAPVRLDQLTELQLATAMGSTNGVIRDLAHRELLPDRDGTRSKRGRFDPGAAEVLQRMVTDARSPAVRVQALAALGALRQMPAALVEKLLADPDPDVRCEALRAGESILAAGPVTPDFQEALGRLTEDATPPVRLQLALSLGAWNDAKAAEWLAKLAATDNQWVRAAALSSAGRFPGVMLTSMMRTPGAESICESLVSGAVSSGKLNQIVKPMLDLTDPVARRVQRPEPGPIGIVASLLDALEQSGMAWRARLRSGDANRSATARADLAGLTRRLEEFIAAARIEAEPGDITSLAGNHTELKRKVACVRLLGRTPDDQARDVESLASWLANGLPEELSDGVLDRLARLRTPLVATEVLKRWNGYLPAVRTALLTRLLGREEWTVAVLTAIDGGTVRASEIPVAVRPQLLKHENQAIRSRAAGVFEPAGTRRGVVSNYLAGASLTGMASRGGAIFEKTCAQCHAFRGRGHAVGPNLGEFAGKSVADFVAAIFDPNAAINPNFTAYNIETRDGRSLTGIVRGETAGSLTLVQGGGTEEKLLRGDLQEIRASQLSLMPEGLEQALSPQDVADLIAWIKSSGPATFGSATPEKARLARTEFLASDANGLAKLVSAGGQLPYPSWLGQWPCRLCRRPPAISPAPHSRSAASTHPAGRTADAPTAQS
jgi:putative heme-binding domain-containing protein